MLSRAAWGEALIEIEQKKVSGQMFVELLWISIVEMKTRRYDFFPNTTFPLGLIPGNRHTY